MKPQRPVNKASVHCFCAAVSVQWSIFPLLLSLLSGQRSPADCIVSQARYFYQDIALFVLISQICKKYIYPACICTVMIPVSKAILNTMLQFHSFSCRYMQTFNLDCFKIVQHNIIYSLLKLDECVWKGF